MTKALFLLLAILTLLIIGCEPQSNESATLRKEMEEMQREIDSLKVEIEKIEKNKNIYEPPNKSDLYNYFQEQQIKTQQSQPEAFAPNNQESIGIFEKRAPTECFLCSGFGFISCTSCDGTGRGGYFDCFFCDGTGRNFADFRCSSCKGTGYGTCFRCSGDGRTVCYSCGGSGEW